jgi:hypothetical protein
MITLRMVPLLVGLMVAVGCGGSSPEQLCKQAITNGCKASLRCNPTSGLTQKQCEEQAAANVNCAEADKSCPAGYKYDADNAQKCLDGFATISCDDLTAGNTPAACAAVCIAN